MTNAKRDNNYVTTLLAVQLDDLETPTPLVVDQATGRLLVNAVVSIDTTGLATDSNQTDGSQKTQIVDAGGEAVTVTGGKLDVNASVDTTGLALDATLTGGTQKSQLVDAGGEAATVTDGKLDVNASIDTTGLATDATDTNTGTIAGDTTSIDGKIPALGQALAAGSVPVVLTAAQITTLTPPAQGLTDAQLRAAAVPVSGTFYQATQPVSADSLPLPAGAATAASQQTDALTDTELRATPVPVSGSLTVDLGLNNDVTVTSGAITETNSGAIKTAIEVIDNAISGSEMQVDVVASLPTGDNNIGNVDIVGGTVTTITDVVHVDDNAGSLTVDGTVTANLSATDNAVLDTIAAKDFATQTTLATVDADTSILSDATQVENEAYAGGHRLSMSGGVRKDADTTPISADGDVHPFVFDETGRLKVSNYPGSVSTYTDDISSNGDIVTLDVSRYSNLMLYCTGTFNTVNCAFEGSIDGGTAWFSVQAVRTSTNTVEATTGNLSAAPAYGWELSVNALTNFRIRATALTSGTQTWRIAPGTYATEPIPAVQSHAVTMTTTTVGGSATVVGFGQFRNIAVSNTDVQIKATAGRVYSWYFKNPHATDTAWVHFYNATTANTTVGTTTPVWSVEVPANGTNETYLTIPMSLATAITLAATTSADHTVSTAPSTAIVCFVGYI